MINTLEEGNLRFNFSDFDAVERFDNKRNIPYGTKAVDFVAENTNHLLFIEIKDFQNPKATPERHKNDFKMLIEAVEEKTTFPLEMGVKIKDSLLRRYALGGKFNKKVVFLLLVNLDKLGESERGKLESKISDHVPTGLNDSRYSAFSEITFELVNAKQLEKYGITCTTKQPARGHSYE